LFSRRNWKLLLPKYSEFKELEKPLTYLKNVWLLVPCIIYPGMEPTNNLENRLCGDVIIRKIIGCSGQKMELRIIQYMHPLLATCRLQEKMDLRILRKYSDRNCA